MDEKEQQLQEQQNVQVEPTPLSPPPSHKNLIIGIVAVFVLVVGGIAGAYFVFQPKAEPVDDIVESERISEDEEIIDTSDWKTYRSEEHGFEFKYPPDMNYQRSTLYDGVNEIDGIYGNSGWILPSSAFGLFPPIYLETLTEVKIDLTTFYLKEKHYDRCRELFFTSPINTAINKRMELILRSCDEHDRPNLIDNNELITAILSTIKFIEPQASVDTSDWKTYRNEEAGIEFQYLSSWTDFRVTRESADQKPVSYIGTRVSIICADPACSFSVTAYTPNFVLLGMESGASFNYFGRASDKERLLCSYYDIKEGCKEFDIQGRKAVSLYKTFSIAGGVHKTRKIVLIENSNQKFTGIVLQQGINGFTAQSANSQKDNAAYLTNVREKLSVGEITLEDKEALETFDQIFSTFKFIEHQASVGDPLKDITFEEDQALNDSVEPQGSNIYDVAACGITFEYNPTWEVREIPGSVADNIMVVIERPEPITSSGIVNFNIPHRALSIDKAIEEYKSLGCNGCEFREPIESEVNGIKVTELYIYSTWNKQDIRPGRFYFKQNDNLCSLNDEAAPKELEEILKSIKVIDS